MSPGILSIQSAVAYGHVGNSAAVFPLQRLGFEVWPIDTVQFSNHTGYGAWRGHMTSPDQIREIVNGMDDQGVLANCIAVVSGYLGDPDVGDSVLEAVHRVRAASPGALYACDPVMGDQDRGFFVKPGIPEFFRDRALASVDVLTPNHFELAWLAGQPIDCLEDSLCATAKLRAMGPRYVVATSLSLRDGPDTLHSLADSSDGAWLIRTPRLPIALNGTGDAFTAMILGAYLQSHDLETALRHAVATIYGLIAATCEAGSRELELIAAQKEIVEPNSIFPVEKVR